LQIGAKALQDLNKPGFFRANIKAPCPPILCPKIANFYLLPGISVVAISINSFLI